MVIAKTLRAADIEPERIRRLWGNYLFLGKVTVIDGDPGLGKSTAMVDIAARVTTHQPMPDGSRSDLDGPASVLILSAEDGAGDTIRTRLEAAGADLERAIIWDCNIDDNGSELLPSLPEDISLMAELIQRHDVAMVTIDPIMAYLGSNTNSYRDQDVRRALAPLAKIGEATGAALVLVRHLNKAMGGSAIYRGGGSIGIVGAARSGLLAAKHPDDENRRILASTKCNLGPQPPFLAYRLEGHANGAGYVVWEGVTAHSRCAGIPAAQR
jgi:RecA-family ATPase